MKKFLFFIFFPLLVFTSCNDSESDENVLPTVNAEKTIFMYLPWTGDNNNLYNNFLQNIKDIEQAIVDENGIGNKNLMIFISKDATHGSLMKVNYSNGACTHDTLRTYENTETSSLNLALNSSHWITYILNQVKSYAPADTFSMIVGCHGMGWIKASDYNSATTASSKRMIMAHRNFDGPPTRWFGGERIMTDISTLATGIAASNVKKLQYILFDDCYLSNIETAYDLKSVTRYLIACPTEIMAYGMPYAKLWKYLADDNPDYKAICNEFYNFYNSYTYNGSDYNCGTIGVTDCAQVDSMATIMKEINTKYTFDTTLTDSLQIMDGYDPSIFFDFDDYVHHLCTDATLLSRFDQQLTNVVPFKANTTSYYSALPWRPGKHPIKTFSGTTISDPSTSNYASTGKKTTAWYTATH